jgi:hypothetical protein
MKNDLDTLIHKLEQIEDRVNRLDNVRSKISIDIKDIPPQTSSLINRKFDINLENNFNNKL